MSGLPVVTIKAQPSKTQIFIDGVEVRSARYFKVEQEVGQEVPTLTLQIIAREVLYDGPAATEEIRCEI